MSFGVYFHIPYCVQRCSYCDFTTFEQSTIEPMADYVSKVKREIAAFAPYSPYRQLDTVYFGGGTPSLLPPALIISLLQSLANDGGLVIKPECEITLEINPATLDSKKLDQYLEAGFNRFSVGAQTFNDNLLKAAGRIHSADDTRNTLKLLQSNGVNYSFDLLFALPKQSLDMLSYDLEEALKFKVNHLSAYCLTVPTGHQMSLGRAPEDDQVEMFSLIEDRLKQAGLLKYEISNFARPGFESRHNNLYWTDQPYLSVGLSAHGYFPQTESAPWGVRYWNPTNFKEYDRYLKQLENTDLENIENRFRSPFKNFEVLQRHESLTDFCHTALRTMRGLVRSEMQLKFKNEIMEYVEPRLTELVSRNWLKQTNDGWSLTPLGVSLSNQVFSMLTFLKTEL